MSAFRSITNKLLDGSIVRSFDRHGFLRHAEAFDSTDLEVDLTGKTALVTGANSGIGKATAYALAARNASVYMLCRSPERAETAKRDIKSKLPSANLSIELVDMSDLESVQKLGQRLNDLSIHILVHNAGVLPTTLQYSPQGHELTFATNILGPQLLNALLERSGSLQKGCRVIYVSSGGMYPIRLSTKELRQPKRPFSGVRSYAVTKRAQVILAEMWAEHWQQNNIQVHSMHPGWADTPGVEHSIPRFHQATQSILRTPEQGADTVIWLACSQRGIKQNTGFWFDRQARSPYLLPWTRESAKQRKLMWSTLQEITQPFLT